MDVVNIYFVLMVTAIFQTACEGLTFVDTQMTWDKARDHCRENDSVGKLACLSAEDKDYILNNLTDGQSIWVGTYTTLSSWFKKQNVRYLHEYKTYQVNSGDKASCQLLCGTYFTVDGTTCRCFQKGKSSTYKFVYKVKNKVNGIREKVENYCNYLFCQKDYITDGNILNEVTSNVEKGCDYSSDLYVAACGLESQTITGCVGFSALTSYGTASMYHDRECTLFRIDITCFSSTCNIYSLDVFSTSYSSGIGMISAAFPAISPVMTCFYGTYTADGNRGYQMQFQETSDCGGYHAFFCDKNMGTADSAEFCNLDSFTFTKPPSTTTTPKLTTTTTKTTTTITVAETTTTEETTTTTTSAKTILPSTTKFATTSTQTATTETSQNEKNESDTTSTQNVTRTPLPADGGTSGAMTGIALGVSLASTAVIVILLIFMWKRYKHKKVEKPSTDQRLSDIQATTNPSYEVHTHSKQRLEYEDTKELGIYQTIEPNEYMYIDSDYNSNAIDKTNAYMEPKMIPKKKVKRGAGKLVDKNTPKGISNAVYEESQNRPHAYLDLKPDGNFPSTDLPENYFVLMPEGANPSAKKESSLPDNYFILEPSAGDNLKHRDRNVQTSKGNNVMVDPGYELQTVPTNDSKVSEPITNAEMSAYSLAVNVDSEAEKMIGKDKKEPLNGDYFVLEAENGNVHNKKEIENEYVDSEEGAYDHLHGTFVRKPDINQDHLYAHTNNLGNRDSTYDTTNGEHRYKRDSTYDSMKDIVGDDSVYDTTCTKN